MNYQHPTIKIETPAPGHFVIIGHAPKTVFIEEVGHVVPHAECYITPEVPSEALIAVLKERGDLPAGDEKPKRAKKATTEGAE